jgi:hypothetical protein
MPDYSEVELLLQTYSFDEILELNDLTEEDVLHFLLRQELIERPDPSPVDI